MTIDILTYELKYKQDRDVLDLLSAYQEERELTQASNDEYIANEDEKDALESEVQDLKDNISQWRKQISSAIDELSDLEVLEDKADILSYVDKALKELDSVEDDMQ